MFIDLSMYRCNDDLSMVHYKNCWTDTSLLISCNIRPISTVPKKSMGCATRMSIWNITFICSRGNNRTVVVWIWATYDVLDFQIQSCPRLWALRNIWCMGGFISKQKKQIRWNSRLSDLFNKVVILYMTL